MENTDGTVFVEVLLQKLKNKDLVLPISQKSADNQISMLLTLVEKGRLSGATFDKERRRLQRTSLDDDTMALFKRAIAEL